MKKKRNILIHPDRIEDLDKTRREQRRKAIEPKRTGYESVCRIRNTRRYRDILFTTDFVSKKMQSLTFMVFHPIGQDNTMMIQPVPVEWINRTSVCHIQERFLSAFRRYGFYADLDRVPEPCEILHMTGINPLAKGYTYKLEEWVINDDLQGQIFGYKLIPLSVI